LARQLLSLQHGSDIVEPVRQHGPDQVAVRDGGVLEFGSPEAEFQFRQFAGRRRITEADLRAGEVASTARPGP